MKTAEIIASGSELTSGDRLNTNAQWISQKLVGMGITPRWHTTLADQMEDHVSALTIASERVDVVVMTGGLGPTQDDLTRDAFARVAGTELVFDAQLLKNIEEVFRTRGVTMPERNRVQAHTPRGARPIPNPVGTAPGIWLEKDGKILIALPGVPREMRHMWDETVVGWLAKALGGKDFVMSHKINLFGLGESAVEEKVMDLTARGHVPEVGITASEAVISLRIVARASDATEARNQVERTKAEIWKRLGEYIFSEGDRSPAQCLSDTLADRKLSLVVGEIGSQGLLTSRLLAAVGDRSLVRAAIAQNPEEWVRGRPDDNLLTLTGVAETLRGEQGCDIAIVMSSNAMGDNTLKSEIAIALPSSARVKTYQTRGPLNEILSRSVNFAIYQLLRAMEAL